MHLNNEFKLNNQNECAKSFKSISKVILIKLKLNKYLLKSVFTLNIEVGHLGTVVKIHKRIFFEIHPNNGDLNYNISRSL